MDILGRMLLLLIRESVSVPCEEFSTEWIQHGLNKAYLPSHRTPQDAFRRATPKKQWKNGTALLDYKGGQHVQEGSSNEVMMVYSKDSTSKVDINHINRAILFLKESKIEVEPFGPLFESEIDFIRTIQKDYETSLSHFDGTQCRNAIQKVLETSSALNYRDGAYLIPREYFHIADALTGIIHFMNDYTMRQNVLWDIPYIDTKDTRQQIRLSLGAYIESTMKACLEEAINLKPTTRNVTKSRKSTLITKLADVGLVIRTYEKTLGENLDYEWKLLSNAQYELERI